MRGRISTALPARLFSRKGVDAADGKQYNYIIDILLHYCNPSVTRNLENFTTETARCGMCSYAHFPLSRLSVGLSRASCGAWKGKFFFSSVNN